MLNKRLKYLHELLQNFKSKRLVMINKDRASFLSVQQQQFSVYNISTDESIIHSFKKVMIKYVGPVVIYKIIDPQAYLLMTLDGKILRGLFEHEVLKPAILRTSEGNINNLSQLKQVINIGLSTTL